MLRTSAAAFNVITILTWAFIGLGRLPCAFIVLTKLKCASIVLRRHACASIRQSCAFECLEKLQLRFYCVKRGGLLWTRGV